GLAAAAAPAGPANLDDRSLQLLVVLDLHLVLARRDGARGGVGRRRLILPAVDDQRAVEINAHAVIGARGEDHAAAGEVEAARPARRDIVGGTPAVPPMPQS